MPQTQEESWDKTRRPMCPDCGGWVVMGYDLITRSYSGEIWKCDACRSGWGKKDLVYKIEDTSYWKKQHDRNESVRADLSAE